MAESRPILEGVEEKASEELGIRRWDRPAIFREAAGAATDGDLPYWTVLLLSGAIATLGLALNSSAVIIGAMLIAPLLGPVVGLALALAVGDGRLAFQTALMVVASTAGVIAVGALLTLALPFQTVTAEISSRTHPTTLDLAIAVFSGLAGVVVTVARGHRLSAAIPGVAIAVALIPPLAVAGFGVGAGWNWRVIHGSLLLYGANLAGIVLSGMGVFLLIGMHRPAVLQTAREWHQHEDSTGLVAWANRFAWVRSLGVIRSTAARIALVLGFVVAVAVPLSRTLEEIVRESRVRSAVEEAAGMFDVPGRSSILSRQVVLGERSTQVYLRVATTEWFGQEAREEFSTRASAAAGEPVRVILEQLPSSSGDVEQLADLLPVQDPRPVVPPPPPTPTRVPDLLASLRERLSRAVASLPLPDGVALAGMDLSVSDEAASRLHVAYLAEDPLPAQAEQILVRQLGRALGDPALHIALFHVPSGFRPVEEGDLAAVAGLVQRFPELRVEAVAGPEAAAEGGDPAAAAGDAAERLARAGADPDRIRARAAAEGGLRMRLFVRAEEAAADPDSVLLSRSPGARRPQP